jgi:hypothetical protein
MKGGPGLGFVLGGFRDVPMFPVLVCVMFSKFSLLPLPICQSQG